MHKVRSAARLGGSHANSVTLGVTRFHKRFSPLLPLFIICCIAELAIKPCRSSRSKLRGEFGIPKHLQNRKQKHNKATKKHKTNKNQKTGFFFSSLAERAITAVPVTALQKEAIVTSSAMPRFHQAETKNKGRQRKKQPSKTNNTTPTKHKPKTKHLSGNRAAYSCTTYN